MAIQNLSVRQIMASFAYLAYCGEDITTPNPDAQILGLINSAIPQIPPITAPNPSWSVVWGPVAYTFPGALYQDNMMFVAQNQSDTSQFVIAIRGTNAISDLDWLAEDFDILQMIPWSTVSPGTTAPATAQISESTSIDLAILLALQDDQPPLLEFLKSQTSKPINLCVTGHSLGGCLAGTLALYLKENRGSWDSSRSSVVCCVTLAAPTAGNGDFATYSDSQFTSGAGFPGWDASLGTNFDAVRCSLDVAPLAWTAAAVTVTTNAPIPPVLNIYANVGLNFIDLSLGTYLAFTTALSFVCPYLVDILAPRNYQQVVSGANDLTGTFNTALAPTSKTLEDYLKAFIAQAEYQHSDSYPSQPLLNVPQLNNPAIIVTNPGVPPRPADARPTRRARRVRFTPT